MNRTNDELVGSTGIVIGSIDEIQAARDASFEEFARQTQESVAATQNEIVVLSGRRFEIQQQIDEQRVLIEATAAQAAANDTLSAATIKIRDVSDGARIAFSNTTSELGRLKDKVGEASDTMGGVLVTKSAAGSFAIKGVTEESARAGITLGSMTTSVDRTSEAADKAAAKMRDQMIPALQDVHSWAGKVNDQLDAMATKLLAVGDASTTAAGD